MFKYLSVLLLAVSLTACANNRETRAAMMGAAAGAIIGTMAAQQSENNAHAAPAHTGPHETMQEHGHAVSETIKGEDKHDKPKKEYDDHEDEHHDSKDGDHKDKHDD